MSRIIHGPSKEIKTYKPSRATSTVQTFAGSNFRTYRVEDTISEAELEDHLKRAREERGREVARDVEKKMQGPLRTALENVENLLDEISRFRRELFKESEAEVLELVRAICKRVVMKELSLQPEQLKEIVSKALESLEKHRKIVLAVSAQDHPIFVKAKPDYLEKFKGIEELEILVDPELERGVASLSTQTTQLEVKLDEMVDHILNYLTNARAPATEVNDEGDQA